MYLLDTNVISELRRGRPHRAVVEWLRGVDEEDLFVSAVTLGELQAGVEIARSRNPENAALIEAWIDQLMHTYSILPMDGRIFRAWARLLHGKPDRLIEDAMIAATASVHQLVVVTRNVRDFERLGVQTLNPFTAAN